MGKVKQLAEELGVFDQYDRYREEIEKLKEENEELKEKQRCLISFLGGNFDYGEKVKTILKEIYTDEFILHNTERWEEIGIDFE